MLSCAGHASPPLDIGAGKDRQCPRQERDDLLVGIPLECPRGRPLGQFDRALAVILASRPRRGAAHAAKLRAGLEAVHPARATLRRAGAGPLRRLCPTAPYTASRVSAWANR